MLRPISQLLHLSIWRARGGDLTPKDMQKGGNTCRTSGRSQPDMFTLGETPHHLNRISQQHPWICFVQATPWSIGVAGGGSGPWVLGTHRRLGSRKNLHNRCSTETAATCRISCSYIQDTSEETHASKNKGEHHKFWITCVHQPTAAQPGDLQLSSARSQALRKSHTTSWQGTFSFQARKLSVLLHRFRK